MTHLGTVAALRRHPVKSMLGEDVAEADVRVHGLAGDRRWALLDLDTKKIVSAKNPRLWRAMLTMAATLEDGAPTGAPGGVDGAAGEAAARIVLPGGESVRTDDPGAGAALSRVLGRRVAPIAVPPEGATLDRAVPEEVLASGVAAEVAVEEMAIGIGAPPGGGFVDFAPVHLIGTATLDAIGAGSPRGTVEAARYRPNLVVDAGGPAFGENDWAGRELAVGDEVVLRVTVPTPRCAIPTLEHGALPRDPAALRVPAARNRVEPMEGLGLRACAGAYAEVVRPGRVRRGAAVRLR